MAIEIYLSIHLFVWESVLVSNLRQCWDHCLVDSDSCPSVPPHWYWSSLHRADVRWSTACLCCYRRRSHQWSGTAFPLWTGWHPLLDSSSPAQTLNRTACWQIRSEVDMELRKERRNQAVIEGWGSTNYFSRKQKCNDGIVLAALHTCYTAMLKQISGPTHFTCKVITPSRS